MIHEIFVKKNYEKSQQNEEKKIDRQLMIHAKL